MNDKPWENDPVVAVKPAWEDDPVVEAPRGWGGTPRVSFSDNPVMNAIAAEEQRLGRMLLPYEKQSIAARVSMASPVAPRELPVYETLESLPRPLRSVGAGVIRSGASTLDLGTRGIDLVTHGLLFGGQEGRQMREKFREIADAASASQQVLAGTRAEQWIGGAAESIADVVTFYAGGALLGAGGKALGLGRSALATGIESVPALARVREIRPLVAGSVLKTMNQASQEADAAGLSGPDKIQYVVGQGAIEGAITAAFSAAGMGGAETALMRERVSTGVRDAVKSIGGAIAEELPEELFITTLQELQNWRAGITPADLDALERKLVDTAATTVLMAGSISGARAAADQIAQRPAQPPAPQQPPAAPPTPPPPQLQAGQAPAVSAATPSVLPGQPGALPPPPSALPPPPVPPAGPQPAPPAPTPGPAPAPPVDMEAMRQVLIEQARQQAEQEATGLADMAPQPPPAPPASPAPSPPPSPAPEPPPAPTPAPPSGPTAQPSAPVAAPGEAPGTTVGRSPSANLVSRLKAVSDQLLGRLHKENKTPAAVRRRHSRSMQRYVKQLAMHLSSGGWRPITELHRGPLLDINLPDTRRMLADILDSVAADGLIQRGMGQDGEIYYAPPGEPAIPYIRIEPPSARRLTAIAPAPPAGQTGVEAVTPSTPATPAPPESPPANLKEARLRRLKQLVAELRAKRQQRQQQQGHGETEASEGSAEKEAPAPLRTIEDVENVITGYHGLTFRRTGERTGVVRSRKGVEIQVELDDVLVPTRQWVQRNVGDPTYGPRLIARARKLMPGLTKQQAAQRLATDDALAERVARSLTAGGLYKAGKIRLSRQHATDETLHEELFHAALDLGIVSRADMELLRKRYMKDGKFDEEAAAKEFASARRQYRRGQVPRSRIGIILRKIVQFIESLRSALRPARGDVIQKLATGELFMREVRRAGAEQAIRDADEKLAIYSWHGSPYKFPKYKLDYVGKGEGASMVAWGSYSGQRQTTGIYYRDTLGEPYTLLLDGKMVWRDGARTLNMGKSVPIPAEEEIDTVEKAIPYVLAQLYSDLEWIGKKRMGRETTKQFLRRILDSFADGLRDRAQEYRDQYNQARAAGLPKAERLGKLLRSVERQEEAIQAIRGRLSLQGGGYLYRLKLNVEPEQLLDWDHKLKDQPQPVQRAALIAYLISHHNMEERDAGELVDRTMPLVREEIELAEPGRGVPARAAPENTPSRQKLYQLAQSVHSGPGPNPVADIVRSLYHSGKTLYRLIADIMGSDKQASLLLVRVGVPGVKYLDGMSRSAGAGTYNYVIFDDKLIDIVERYQLLPDQQEILDQVRRQPPRGPTLIQRLKRALQKKTGHGFSITWTDRLSRRLTDSLAPVISAIHHVKAQRGIRDAELDFTILPEHDPELLLRRLGRLSGILHDWHQNGLRNARGERIIDPVTGTAVNFEYLLGAFNASSLEKMQEGMDDALALGVALRTLEKWKQAISPPPPNIKPGTRAYARWVRQQRRLVNPTGIGGGQMPDALRALRFIRSLRNQRARWDIAWEALRRYRFMADNMLQYLVDVGWISDQTRQTIAASNVYYFNLGRVMDSGDPGVAPSNPLHRFKGSSRLIEHPYVNLLASVDRMVRVGERNRALAALVGLVGSDQAIAERVAPQPGKPLTGVIPIRVNGDVQYWKFQPDIHESLEHYGRWIPEALMIPLLNTGLLNIPGKLSRELITASPAFIIRNLIRDMTHRSVVSVSGSKPWEIFSSLSQEEIADLEAYGGSLSHSSEYAGRKMDYYDALADKMRELAGERNTLLYLPRRLAAGWGRVREGSELAGRLAEYRHAYKMARQRGLDEYNAGLWAAQKAADLLDYSIAGDWIRQINRICYIPFLNAGIQGVTRTARALHRSPARSALRMFLYVVVPGLLEYAWASRDDERKRRWLQLPAWRRDFFFNFPVGDYIITVPKPFEIGVLASGVNRLIDMLAGEPNAFHDYHKSLWNAIVPLRDDVFGGPFKVVVEQLMNHSTFFDRPIIPAWEVGMDISLRGTERASRLGRAIQAVSTQLGQPIDARRVDAFVRSLAGGTGGLLLDVSDIGRTDKGVSRLVGSFSGMVTVPPAAASVDVQRALDTARLLGDTSEPVEALQSTLRAISRSTDMVHRNRLADQAVQLAQGLLKFYDPNYDDVRQLQRHRRELARLEAEYDMVPVEQKDEFLQKYGDSLLKKRRLDKWWNAINQFRQLGQYDDAAQMLHDVLIAEELTADAVNSE